MDICYFTIFPDFGTLIKYNQIDKIYNILTNTFIPIVYLSDPCKDFRELLQIFKENSKKKHFSVLPI
jgi:hypothetical protein